MGHGYTLVAFSAVLLRLISRGRELLRVVP